MAVTPVCTLGPGPEQLMVLKPTLRLGTSTRALRGPGWPGNLKLLGSAEDNRDISIPAKRPFGSYRYKYQAYLPIPIKFMLNQRLM